MPDKTTMEFQGKDIADAISKACKALKASQEDLDIEVLTTGTTGIFGLMKQKARLRVSLKKEYRQEPEKPEKTAKAEKTEKPARPNKKQKKPAKRQEKPSPTKVEESRKTAPVKETPAVQEKAKPAAPPEPVSDELLEQVKKDLSHILELVGWPSEIKISADMDTVNVQIEGDYVKAIIDQNGKVLDSLQYVIRKMVSQKFPGKATISLDAGNFRENRLQELKELALKLAEEAKETSKTRSISSLNPSERRVVHVALQDDKEIRSRRVGDGLFKKVLIYKPGSKGKKSSSRRRKGPRKGNNR